MNNAALRLRPPVLRRLRAWFGRNPLLGDTLLACAVVLFSAASWGLFASVDTRVPPPQLLDALWLVAGVTPILVRRLWIWVAVGLTATLMLAGLIDVSTTFSLSYSIYIVGYTVAATKAFKPALLSTLALWASVTAVNLADARTDLFGSDTAATILINYITGTIAFGIGRAVFNRRAKLSRLEERARLAEENQAVMATQAVADERRRIARELHDVVAHHISVMGVMATGARRALRRDPDAADEALQTIETTGRATLREMKRLLNVLRASDESDDGLSPQPGLDAIEAMIEQFNRAGLPAKLDFEGEAYPVDSGISLTVYRIVQESLTNTLKHAGPARAGVRISYRHDGLDVEVADSGYGPTAPVGAGPATGHGLVGMRERVALYGGTLRIGPRPGGGFRVHAAIPIDASAAALAAVEPGGNS